MALDTIGSEVGADAILETPRGVGGGGQGAQGMNAGDVAGEVTCLIESSDLIVRQSAVIELPIELRRVETQGPTGYTRMTTQTLATAGIVPNLRVSFVPFLNGFGQLGAT